jgi:hypothetical protein
MHASGVCFDNIVEDCQTCMCVRVCLCVHACTFSKPNLRTCEQENSDFAMYFKFVERAVKQQDDVHNPEGNANVPGSKVSANCMSACIHVCMYVCM